jgi:hypothetical protein
VRRVILSIAGFAVGIVVLYVLIGLGGEWAAGIFGGLAVIYLVLWLIAWATGKKKAPR